MPERKKIAWTKTVSFPEITQSPSFSSHIRRDISVFSFLYISWNIHLRAPYVWPFQEGGLSFQKDDEMLRIDFPLFFPKILSVGHSEEELIHGPLGDDLDMLHELRVEEGEPCELVLVEVHHEEFVGGREVGLLGGELLVEVAHVLAMALGRKDKVSLDFHGKLA